MAGKVALTFDDGPNPVWTPRVLDALAEAGARATFFVLAPAADKHPQLLRRAEQEGHEVGLHCERHVRHDRMKREEMAFRGSGQGCRMVEALAALLGSLGSWGFLGPFVPLGGLLWVLDLPLSAFPLPPFVVPGPLGAWNPFGFLGALSRFPGVLRPPFAHGSSVSRGPDPRAWWDMRLRP
jgi:hypothetical protein